MTENLTQKLTRLKEEALVCSRKEYEAKKAAKLALLNEQADKILRGLELTLINAAKTGKDKHIVVHRLVFKHLADTLEPYRTKKLTYEQLDPLDQTIHRKLVEMNLNVHLEYYQCYDSHADCWFDMVVKW